MKFLTPFLLALVPSSVLAGEGDARFFQNGEYGTSSWYCGIRLEKNLREDKLLLTYTHNALRPELHCSGFGKTVEYDCKSMPAGLCGVSSTDDFTGNTDSSALKPGNANEMSLEITTSNRRDGWEDTASVRYELLSHESTDHSL